ncbi:hypothetical protein EDB81DRAFT_671533 [Dactylonectria macrodidyma]|uniref:Uncharacterized protein n=1 Tax=Dactylonectria macrodidyma TaxID=307937 RepID=A0A9P9D220_9HYPO|nr:hypothetical protein EDB81DRAFT_671533 [Dactylonectria macrodidyma]
MPNAATASGVVVHLRGICHIHYRIHARRQESEPETFFEVLGLNPNAPPFNVVDEWVNIDRPLYRAARDAIGLAWAEKKQRIQQERLGYGSEEDAELDIVAWALHGSRTASIYMKVVMPKIHHIHGAERLEALVKVCADQWNDGDKAEL